MNQIPIGKNDDTLNDAEGITQQEDGFARYLENLDRQIAEHGPDFAFSATKNEQSEDLEAAASVIRMLERIRRSSDLPSSLSFSNEGGSALPEEEPANPIEDANATSSIGRFVIKRRVGQGGFGVVFQAFDPELKRHVAIKIPRLATLIDPQSQRRFEREGTYVALLNHPHIVPVYEAGRNGGLPYLASAWIEGESLAQSIRRTSEPVEPRLAANLVMALADAVQHAHSRGVLHLDIKPANILLEKQDSPHPKLEPGNIRLTDFGLARFHESRQDPRSQETMEHEVVGTPSYMSPEQARGETAKIGVPSDVYGLGMVLRELLNWPNRQSGNGSNEEKSLDGDMSIRLDRPRIPPDIAAICTKCLATEPAERYESAADLRDDLARFLENRPVLARPITTRERLMRWCRRNPLPTALIVLVAILIVGLIGGATASALTLKDSRDRVLDHLARETKAKETARRSERLAQRAHFDSILAQAELLQQSGRIGQRVEVLDLLETAAQRLDELQLDGSHRLTVRNLMISALSRPDAELDRTWNVDSITGRKTTVAPNGKFFAVARKGGSVDIRRTQDGEMVRQLRSNDRVYRPAALSFGPRGRHFAGEFFDGKDGRLLIWDLLTGRQIADFPCASRETPHFDFDRQEKRLVYLTPDHRVEVLQLDSKKRESPAIETLGTFVRFIPEDQRVALGNFRKRMIEILDLKTGETIHTLPFPEYLREIVVDQDGSQLAAVGHDGLIQVWDLDTGRTRLTIEQAHNIGNLAFDSTGRYLAVSHRRLHETRIWDVNLQQIVLTLPGSVESFSNDGRWLLTRERRYRFHTPTEHVILRPINTANKQSIGGLQELSVHPEGRLLIASGMGQLVAWDLERLEAVDIKTIWPENGIGRKEAMHFSDNGSAIVQLLAGSIRVLPLDRKQAAGLIRYELGMPETLDVPVGMNPASVAVATNSPFTVVTSQKHDRKTRLVDRASKTVEILAPTDLEAAYATVTANGRLAATSSLYEPNEVWIWDLAMGRCLHRIPVGQARIVLSADGRFLAVCEKSGCSIYDPKTGREVVERIEFDGLSRAPVPAFTHNGELLAVQHSAGKILLLETGDFHEIAQLELPARHAINAMRFSPTGDRLIAAASDQADYVHAWNLRTIRAALQASHLDWGAPPFPSKTSKTSSHVDFRFSRKD